MCGLAAYFAYHPAALEVDREALSRVARAMRARGPDGQGAWHSADGRAALAHTRLAIIAPGEAGAQPMASADRTLVLSYNGEIYNHAALRAELQARGHTFRGGSDTEVLLAMYREYGEGMLPRLRGMFAFALWDAPRRELVLARDAHGIKPLYYADDGWTLRAASQVKALLHDGALRTSPDPAGRAGFYLLGSVPEPFTLHREIRALPAGCVMRVGGAGPGLPRRWFSLPGLLADGARTPTPAAEDAARIRAALLDSVAAHLVADVPVAVFLSSGLDSGVLLALARELGHEPCALTLSFDAFAGSGQDEAALAARTAERYRVRHVVRRVGVAEFEADLPRILDAMDQPSIDGLNTWFISKAAAEQGFKTALSGVGGDELLAGYPSYRQVPWLARLTTWPGRVPGLAALSARLAAPLVRGAGLHPKLAGVLALGGGYPGGWFLRRALFMPWELGALMGEEAAREGLQRLALRGLLESSLEPDPGSARARVTALETCMYLRNQLLRDADWAGMAHGVEVRTPLVDAALSAALAPVLAARSGTRGKAVLAGVPAHRLPAEITARPKRGFHVPFDAWLRHRGAGADDGVRMPAHVAAVRRWARQVAQAA